jgi:hypothetical protein
MADIGLIISQLLREGIVLFLLPLLYRFVVLFLVCVCSLQFTGDLIGKFVDLQFNCLCCLLLGGLDFACVVLSNFGEDCCLALSCDAVSLL